MISTAQIVVIVLLVVKWGTVFWLDRRNLRAVERARTHPPEALLAVMDRETLGKAADYTRAKSGLGQIDRAWGNIVLAALLLGGLPWMYEALTGVLGTGIWGQSLVVLVAMILIGWLDLPFDWYEQFRLEERFGFNKSTQKTWITDQLLQAGLGLIIGVPLCAVLLWLFEAFPGTWWLLGFAVFFGFQLLMLVLYPNAIMPLFNKFSPLEDETLRQRLMDLAERTGFKARTIQVMDGSKRSAHANAFFAGFGKFRKIVLYDTLIEQLGPDELEAVLAHEIGHDRLGHIPKLLLMAGISGFAGFAVLGWASGQPWLYTQFGFAAEAGAAPLLLLLMVAGGLFSFWLTPLSSALSRKFEYQADAFARQAQGAPEPLIRALRALTEKNLSNPAPDKVYSRFYYSHPTLLEREEALRSSAEPA